MKVFVIGASGLIGSHCLHHFKTLGWEVKGSHITYPTATTVYYDPVKEDTRNFDLQAIGPDLIIHCGAFTNVDACEYNSQESEQSTVGSAEKLATYCKQTGARLVYLSTDYVFDGKNGPYAEEDKVNPLNVYGKHKLMAEELVKQVPGHVIARVTNVYGEEERDKNFVSRLVYWFRNSEPKELQLASDQFATPVYAGDIARMLGLLIIKNEEGVFHLSSTDYYNRYHLAQKVKSFFPGNNSVKIVPATTPMLKQPALRPLLGGLLNAKFISNFPEFSFTNIDSYISRIIKNDVQKF